MTLRRFAILSVGALSVAACAGGDQLEEAPVASEASPVKGNNAMRACRNDVLYVDVPVNVPVSWTNAAFVQDVASDLAAAANAVGGSWFCGSTGCMGQVRVTATSVLAPHPSDPLAAGADLRFFRFRFENVRGAKLTLVPDAACTAVATLRTAFENRSGTAWTRNFYTGRECDGLPMNAESTPSPEMLSWHLQALGLSTTPAIAPPITGTEMVDVALIDSGISGPVANAVGVESSFDVSSGGALHPHGSVMSVLLRQLTPDARVHDVRALGTGGHATSEQIARALEHAIFSTGNAPLVLNLSFGWPAELGNASLLLGASCASHEDPFGEPVRYLLDVARRKDTSAQRAIFISAAAGNRALPNASSSFPPPTTSWNGPACPVMAPTGTPYFFPAEWDRLTSCRDHDPQLTRAAFAVGAIDHRGNRAAVSIAAAETPLVAPGQHVSVQVAGTPTAPLVPACSTANQQPIDPQLPASLSGTSVSAALVAGAAARAQSYRLANSMKPLTHTQLARLMYLTGEGIDRLTANGTPVRRLNVARMDRALQEPSCDGLLTCGPSALDPIPMTLLHDCAIELAQCGLETRDQFGALAPSYPPMANRPLQPPPGYQSLACHTGTGVPAAFDAASCASTCPDLSRSDRYLLGSLGPQPGGDGCPWCFATVQLSVMRMELSLELSTKFPSGTTFTEPYLIVKGRVLSSGATNTYYVNLLPFAPAAQWRPGKNLQFSFDTAAIPVDWRNASATLLMTVNQPGQLAAADTSALVLSISTP